MPVGREGETEQEAKEADEMALASRREELSLPIRRLTTDELGAMRRRETRVNGAGELVLPVRCRVQSRIGPAVS